jgi:hypothetical protein
MKVWKGIAVVTSDSVDLHEKREVERKEVMTSNMKASSNVRKKGIRTDGSTGC